MVKQKDVFLEGEGDAWFDRNHEVLGVYDPVTPIIKELKLKPTRALEIGCANGWRLARLREVFGCEVCGVEPSMKAAMNGTRFRVPIYQMTASTLPAAPKQYDLIIYGFCLYLTDPDDWLTIAAEADRALVDGGHIIIHDFADCYASDPLFAKHYDHRLGVMAYHFDFARLWTGNPLYTTVAYRDGPHVDGVTVLQKRSAKDVIEVLK